MLSLVLVFGTDNFLLHRLILHSAAKGEAELLENLINLNAPDDQDFCLRGEGEHPEEINEAVFSASLLTDVLELGHGAVDLND